MIPPEIIAKENRRRKPKPVFDFGIVAELSALHELSALALAETREDLAQEAIGKVARLFGARGFAVLSGLAPRQEMIIASGFKTREEALARMVSSSRGENLLVLVFNEGEAEQDVMVFEHSRPIDDRTRRLCNVLARRLEDRLCAFRQEERRRRMEEALRESQEQLLQVRLMESIGQMATGIAHEINTPVQFVGDNLQFLKGAFEELMAACEAGGGTGKGRRPGLDDLCGEIPRALAQSEEGIRRIAKIVLAMKEFSHPDRNEDPVEIDINRALDLAMTMTHSEWKYVAETRTEFAPDLPMVHGFPGELNQVFLNLIVNAAQAIREKVGDSGEKGSITIYTQADPHMVEIRIADTGNGIPEPNRPRIFELFFTTKPPGLGTGQGLALAHRTVVTRHQGTLSFETREGEGTTFIVRLPVRPRRENPGA